MPLLKVEGQIFEVEDGKRLILALEDGGLDVMHRCGGFAKCTTCRVKFIEGEPIRMTQAEFDRLKNTLDLLGQARLACQIVCDHDMEVEPVIRLSNADVKSPGARPEKQITPKPIWIERPY